jgi:hypothetical protein
MNGVDAFGVSVLNTPVSDVCVECHVNRAQRPRVICLPCLEAQRRDADADDVDHASEQLLEHGAAMGSSALDGLVIFRAAGRTTGAAVFGQQPQSSSNEFDDGDDFDPPPPPGPGPAVPRGAGSGRRRPTPAGIMHPKAATFIVPNKPKTSTLFSGEEPAGRASDEYVNVTLTPKHVPVSATAASAGQSRRATAFGPLRDDTQLPPAAPPPAPKAALNVAFVDDDDDNDDDDPPPPPPPASEYGSTSAALARHASAGEDNYSSTAAMFAAMNAAAQAAAGAPGSSANYASIQPLAGTAPRSEYTAIQPLESRTAEYTGLAANEFFVAPQKPLPQRTPARGRGSPAAPPSPTPGVGSAARGLPARRGVPVTAAPSTVRRPPAPLGSTHPPLSAPPSVPPSSSQQQQQQQQQQAPAAPSLPSWDVRNAGEASARRAPLRRADSDDIDPPPPPPPADASDSPAAAPRRVITYEQFPRRNQQYVSLGPEGIKPIADAPAAPPVSSRKPAPVAAAPNQYGSLGHVLAPLNYATLSQSEQVTPARK